MNDTSEILSAYTNAFAGDPGALEPALDDPPPQRNGHQVSGNITPAHLRYPTLDWKRAFERLPEDVDWLVPDFLVRGSLYSLV